MTNIFRVRCSAPQPMPRPIFARRSTGSGGRSSSARRRRLAEAGQLEYAALDAAADVDAWIEDFLQVEAISWKGKGGRALVANEADRDYFAAVAREAFRRGQLMMLALRFDGRVDRPQVQLPLRAGLLRLQDRIRRGVRALFARRAAGAGEHPRLHARPEIRWMDSCADADHFMINRLWTDRRTIQSVVIGAGRSPGGLVVAAIPLLKWISRRVSRRGVRARVREIRGRTETRMLERRSRESHGENAPPPGNQRLPVRPGLTLQAAGDRRRDLSRPFNRIAFPIRHRLADHPLFSISGVSSSWPGGCPTRASNTTQRTSRSPHPLYEGPRTGLSTEETIRRIEECGSWMVLKNVEIDPEYRALLDRCLDQVQGFIRNRSVRACISGRGSSSSPLPRR